MPDVTAPDVSPVPAKKSKLEKATTGDLVLSVLLPGWGVLVGLIALVKGEGKRAATMIGIGGAELVILLWLRALGPS